MTTTHQVSKETAQAISAELRKAAEEIFAKHGLQTSKQVSKYGEWYDFRIEAVAIEEGLNGVNLASKEASYYSQYGWTAYASDFTPTELVAPLGTIYKDGRGDEFVFAGIDPKKKKNPIVLTRLGKTYNAPESIISALNSAVK